MSLRVEVAGKSDIGCLRSNNEDSFGYDSEIGLFVVCDGMGGAAAGEVASNMAVTSLIDFFRGALVHAVGPEFADTQNGALALSRAIEAANREIRQGAAENPSRAGMGSTIVAVLVNGSVATIAHVGDSRTYLVHDGNISQLTNDHSHVMEEVRRGLLNREDVQRSQFQNIILRALGAEDTVQPDVTEIPVAPGDILLLTTDGLVRHVDDARILELIKSAATLEAACEALIGSAKANGGSDNITCLLVRIVEVGEQHHYRHNDRAS